LDKKEEDEKAIAVRNTKMKIKARLAGRLPPRDIV
jgi:hypothetical protein